MTPYREFVGADGRTWIAWLANPARHADEWAALRAGDIPEPWLCFSGGRRVHRLRPVPADWDQLDEPALVQLWRQAMEASDDSPPFLSPPAARRTAPWRPH